MASALFAVTALKPAEDFYLSLPEDDQAEVGRLVTLLRVDPYIDGRFKFAYPAEVVILTVYDTEAERRRG